MFSLYSRGEVYGATRHRISENFVMQFSSHREQSVRAQVHDCWLRLSIECLGNIVVLHLREFECIGLDGIKITSVIKAIGILRGSHLGIIQSTVVGNFHVI